MNVWKEFFVKIISVPNNIWRCQEMICFLSLVLSGEYLTISVVMQNFGLNYFKTKKRLIQKLIGFVCAWPSGIEKDWTISLWIWKDKNYFRDSNEIELLEKRDQNKKYI